MLDLVQSQLMDPLRAGLILGLVFTMYRTARVTGQTVPLLAGVLFVAVILPLTNPKPPVTLTDAVLAGLVSNLVLLGIVLGLATLWRRFRR